MGIFYMETNKQKKNTVFILDEKPIFHLKAVLDYNVL